MLILKMFGGLGNELFQYALYRKLKMLGKEVFCDIRPLERVNAMGLPTISVFPHADISAADSECCDKLGDNSENILARARRKVRRKKTHVFEDTKKIYFQPGIFAMDRVYLEGYWQSELYFKDIRDVLLKELCFLPDCGNKNQELVLKMQTGVSVGVHIRRGDYLSGKNQEVYGNVCTDGYYDRAIAYFVKKYRNPHFYFFSNDPAWVATRFCDTDMTVVDWNTGKDSYWDMYLMSRCHHNIIANSSFSWWGAWLNEREGKEVVAPKYWFNPAYKAVEDTVCEGWIKLEA